MSHFDSNYIEYYRIIEIKEFFVNVDILLLLVITSIFFVGCILKWYMFRLYILNVMSR